ncbi:MAG TPA: hypothetical protein VH988_33870 [Thermoanaerobaculia bacterium]|jgi:hypothetical protein|nr:hypothetical protein [Thermoanaerobaculia bacterium]
MTKKTVKPSRAGIQRFEGDIRELDQKVEIPGALLIAQYEGLRHFWDYDQLEHALVLYVTWGGERRETVLQIPLMEDERALLRGHREKGGWGYYELHVEEADDRAAVNVSFIGAKAEPISILWIIDQKRRAAARKAINHFTGENLFSG